MEGQPILFKNRYQVLDELGQGGMASVYKAQDNALGRIVALKVLHRQYSRDPGFLARFHAEARAAANLDHPNIVDVFDVGQDGDQHFIVMEYVNGRDLKDVIRSQAPLAVQRAVDLAIQICAAVGYAHRNGLIHRDVKPQNVLATLDDRIKVTDFGIARAVAEAGPTEPGTVWGTAQYLAPEQALGKPASPASDVYALGVVLYEMLAGRLPFEADTRQALVIQTIQAEPLPLRQLNPQVPARLEGIIAQAMAKDPARRFQNGDEFGQALRGYRRRGEEMTAPVTVTEPGRGARPGQLRETTAAAPVVTPRARQRPAPASKAQPGPDIGTLIIGLIAVLAVAGLIPLWIMVYDAYTARPAPAPGSRIERSVGSLGLPGADRAGSVGAGFAVGLET